MLHNNLFSENCAKLGVRASNEKIRLLLTKEIMSLATLLDHVCEAMEKCCATGPCPKKWKLQKKSFGK